MRLLNEDPKLSNDRFVCVRQTTRTSRSCEGEAVSEPDGKEFGLFDDVVYKKSNSFGVGKICRIRKKGASRGYEEYKMPVKFDSNLKNISIVVAEYTYIDGNVDIFTVGTSLIEIRAEKLITTITLEYNVIMLRKTYFYQTKTKSVEFERVFHYKHVEE